MLEMVLRLLIFGSRLTRILQLTLGVQELIAKESESSDSDVESESAEDKSAAEVGMRST